LTQQVHDLTQKIHQLAQQIAGETPSGVPSP
jgi:hypothetical protein